MSWHKRTSAWRDAESCENRMGFVVIYFLAFDCFVGISLGVGSEQCGQHSAQYRPAARIGRCITGGVMPQTPQGRVLWPTRIQLRGPGSGGAFGLTFVLRIEVSIARFATRLQARRLKGLGWMKGSEGSAQAFLTSNFVIIFLARVKHRKTLQNPSAVKTLQDFPQAVP
jgi:hypothetical protein